MPLPRSRHVPVLLLVAGVVCAVTACSAPSPESDALAPMPDSGITSLQSTDLEVGAGAEARPGMTVSVHYTGWLYDASAPDRKGAQFDSSRERNEPFEFPLGARQVIDGWDEGIVGMKTGGRRELVIPPSMGYGPRGSGTDIPPNATLVFDVELVGVR